MNTLLQNVIVQGVISGIIASSIFLIFLFIIKPSIVISDKIACQYVTANGRDERYYLIKIINKSLFFKVYDVKVKAFICESLANANAQDVHRNEIEVKGAEQWVLHRLYYKHILQNLIRGDSFLQSRTDYAAQFATKENLKSILDKNRFLTVEVFVKHSLTGFTKIVTMHYKHRSKIEDGTFYSGNSCKILNNFAERKQIEIK